ncbi:EF-hand calcium-binding domain-containing protein 8 [Trichechus inunguis]
MHAQSVCGQGAATPSLTLTSFPPIYELARSASYMVLITIRVKMTAIPSSRSTLVSFENLLKESSQPQKSYTQDGSQKSKNVLSSPTPSTTPAQITDFQHGFELFAELQLSEMEKIFEDADATGGKALNMKAFLKAMKTVLSNVSDEVLEAIFLKVDSDCSGFVTWQKYVDYLVHEFRGKEAMRRSQYRLRFHLPMRIIPQNHGCEIVKVEYLIHRFKKIGHFLTVTKNGTLQFWSESFLLLSSFRLNQIQRPYNQQMWVIDMVCLHNMDLIAIASADQKIEFFDISNNKCDRAFTFIELDSCVLVMNYWSDYDRGVFCYGDTKGNVFVFTSDNMANGLFNPRILPRASKWGEGKAPTEITRTQPRFSPRTDNWITVSMQKLLNEKSTSHKSYQLKAVHPNWCQQVKFIPQLNLVASCSAIEKSSLVLSVLPSKTPDNLKSSVLNLRRGILCFDYFPDKNFLVTGGYDPLICLWNPLFSTKPVWLMKGHQTSVTHILVSNTNSSILISISKDKNIRVWDMQDYVCLQSFCGKLFALGNCPITSAYFHKDDTLVCSTYSIGVLNGYLESQGPEKAGEKTTTHRSPLCAVLYSKNFKQVVSGSLKGMVNVWEVTTGRDMMEFSVVNARHVELTAMALDESERCLLTGLRDGTIKMWNYNNGECLWTFPNTDQLEISGIIHMSQGFYVTGWSKRITYMRFHKTKPVPLCHHWQTFHTEDVLSMAKYQNQFLGTSSYNGDILFWNVSWFKPILKFNASESPLPLQPKKVQGMDNRPSEDYGASKPCVEQQKWAYKASPLHVGRTIGSTILRQSLTSAPPVMRHLKEKEPDRHGLPQDDLQNSGRCYMYDYGFIIERIQKKRCIGKEIRRSPLWSFCLPKDALPSYTSMSCHQAGSSPALQCLEFFFFGSHYVGMIDGTIAHVVELNLQFLPPALQKLGFYHMKPVSAGSSRKPKVSHDKQPFSKEIERRQRGSQRKMVPANTSVEKIIFLQTRPRLPHMAALLSSCIDGYIYAWSIHGNGGLLGKFPVDFQDNGDVVVGAMATDENDWILVTGDCRGCIKVRKNWHQDIWDIKDYCISTDHHNQLSRNSGGKAVSETENKFQLLIPKQLQVSPSKYMSLEEKQVVDGQTISLTPPKLLITWKGHLESVEDILYVDSFQMVISAGLDRNVKAWKLDGDAVGTFGLSVWSRLQDAKLDGDPEQEEMADSQDAIPKVSQPEFREERDLAEALAYQRREQVVLMNFLHGKEDMEAEAWAKLQRMAVMSPWGREYSLEDIENSWRNWESKDKQVSKVLGAAYKPKERSRSPELLSTNVQYACIKHQISPPVYQSLHFNDLMPTKQPDFSTVFKIGDQPGHHGFMMPYHFGKGLEHNREQTAPNPCTSMPAATSPASVLLSPSASPTSLRLQSSLRPWSAFTAQSTLSVLSQESESISQRGTPPRPLLGCQPSHHRDICFRVFHSSPVAWRVRAACQCYATFDHAAMLDAGFLARGPICFTLGSSWGPFGFLLHLSLTATQRVCRDWMVESGDLERQLKARQLPNMGKDGRLLGNLIPITNQDLPAPSVSPYSPLGLDTLEFHPLQPPGPVPILPWPALPHPGARLRVSITPSQRAGPPIACLGSEVDSELSDHFPNTSCVPCTVLRALCCGIRILVFPREPL